MTIKDFFSGLLNKSDSSGGWHLFLSSNTLEKKKSKEYYFGIIFSAVDAIAKGVQNVDYGLYQKKGDEWFEVEDHDAIKLLKTPNLIHSDRDILYSISSHIDLFGQSFLWPVKTKMASKKIVELRLINPGEVQTKPDYENLIAGYKWNTQGKTREFDPQELVNILRPDPLDMINGLSTIGKARYEADNELNSQKLNASFYENGGLPSGVIGTDQPIDNKTFQSIKMRIKQQYEGAKNAYKMMFLTHGMKYSSIQPTQRDMEYVSQRKLNRDQILAIFQVPKSIVAVSEQVNKSVSEVEVRAFMENVVEPRLRIIFEKLNRFYLPLFDGTENMEFRFVSPIPADNEFQLAEKIASVRKWRTPNEIREEEGRDPIEGGDSLDSAVNFSFNPSSVESDEDDTPDESSKAKDTKKKTQIELLEEVVQSKQSEKECSNCNNPDHKHEHKHKAEELPKPSDQKNKDDREYTRRRNNYINAKEKKFALELNQHLQFLIRDISKQPIAKGYEDLTPEEQLELTPEVVSSKILPDDEKLRQWETLLFLMVLNNHTQMWKTINKQMNDVYGYEPINLDEGVNLNYISNRSNFTSKSVNETVFKRIRSTIDQSVKDGEIDLKKIKKNILSDLKDAKDWKVEQIARTELAWSYGEAQMKIFEQNKVKEVKWMCGSGACEICKANCGKVVELNKTFPSGHTNEPAHVNCACMVVAA